MRILISTTSDLQGWNIDEYLGPVSAQFVIGTGVLTDFLSTWTDLFGIHSKAYQEKLDRINEEALDLISEKASRMGATVVLGLRIDHDEVSAGGKSMLMVTATGTAARGKMAGPAGGAEPRPQQASVSAGDLQVMVRCRGIVENAKNGRVEWGDRSTWEHILQHRLEEVAEPFLDHCEQRIRSDSSIKEKLGQYFHSIPRSAALPHLYGCLKRGGPVYDHAVTLLHEISGFDGPRLLAALGDPDATIASRAVGFTTADQPRYGPEDIPCLEELIEVMEQRFTATPLQEVKGILGTKRHWVCECGEKVDDMSPRCSECARDRWGFVSGPTKPQQAISALHRKVRALRALFDGPRPESDPPDHAEQAAADRVVALTPGHAGRRS